MSGAVDPGFRSPESGRMEDTGAYQLGNWSAQNIFPKTLGVVAKATQPVQIGNTTIPGWANALATGGLAGMALGGLWNRHKKKSVRRGMTVGGMLGAGALGLGAYTMNNPDWFKKIPGLGAFARGGQAPYTPSSGVPTSTTGRPLANPVKAGSAKQAEFGTSEGGDALEIVQKLWRDTSLSQQEKQTLANEVANLAESDAVQLNRLLRSVFGAGAGMLVAKFLFGRGKRGMIISGIVGALSGALGARRNTSKPTHNRFGQAYYF